MDIDWQGLGILDSIVPCGATAGKSRKSQQIASILDDAFLAGFRKQKTPDLQVLLLEKLLRDDLELRRRENLVQYRTFREMLDDTITRYNNRAIQAADVVQVMVEIRQAQVRNDRRKQELGLSDEELAFYDVIREGTPQGIPSNNEWIASLVRDVVQSVRGNVKVDWTRSHRGMSTPR